MKVYLCVLGIPFVSEEAEGLQDDHTLVVFGIQLRISGQ